jgi:hypothetical protein
MTHVFHLYDDCYGAGESPNSGSIQAKTEDFSLLHIASRPASGPISILPKDHRLLFRANKTIEK